MLSIAGCTGGADKPANESATIKPAVKTERRGPVTLSLTVSNDAPTLSDRVHVIVEAVAAPDVVVELADYGAAMRKQEFGYKIVDQTTTTAAPTDDGRLLWKQDYAVDFLVAGSHEFPPAKLTYIDERSVEADAEVADATADDPSAAGVGADAASQAQSDASRAGGGRGDRRSRDSSADDASPSRPAQALETEPITITVDAGANMEFSDEQLAEVKLPAPVEMNEPQIKARRRWWILGAIAGGVMLAAATAWWLVRRSRRPRPEIVIPPHVWAKAELARLLAAGLIEAGRTQEFYVRLSGIVREYMERRFDLRMPEMTTEEFLEAAMAGEILGRDMKAALATFLEACDLVKFARYAPEQAEVDESAAAAVRFVEQTQPRADLMPPSQTVKPRQREEQPA